LFDSTSFIIPDGCIALVQFSFDVLVLKLVIYPELYQDARSAKHKKEYTDLFIEKGYQKFHL